MLEKKLTRSIFIVVALCALLAVCVVSYKFYSKQRKQTQAQSVYSEATLLVDSGRPKDALDLLNQNFNPSQVQQDLKAWSALMVRAALESRNFTQLEFLLEASPELLMEDESAALWWARTQMHRGMWSEAVSLRDAWKAKMEAPDRWRLLEADYHLLSRDKAQAIESLNAWTGEGQNEANRQLRLVMLAEDDAALYAALKQAHEAMPTSAEVRGTAAQFYDSRGSHVFARREYIAAYLLAPENPIHADQLAEFYRRHNTFPLAIQTWRESYQKTGDARTWWKIWFWERVTRSRGPALEVSSAEWWGNLPGLLSQTPEARFLPEGLEGAAEDYTVPPVILKDDEAFHWLCVLELLRQGNEAAALNLLESMPRNKPELAADLRTLLHSLLSWRVRGHWPRGVALKQVERAHRFFREWSNFRPTAKPSDLDSLSPLEAFAVSDWAASSLFLANGWVGAAYRLQPEPIPAFMADSAPELDWIPFAQMKVKASLIDPESALPMATLYPEDTAVQGFAAECELLSGQIDSGLSKLEQIMKTPGPAGFRAAYLRALAAWEEKDYGLLAEIMAGRADLAGSISGRELMARAALSQGETAQTEAIYESLGTQSFEGSVYRFRAAMRGNDVARARVILDDLIYMAPNEPIFHQWKRELDTPDD